MEKHSQKCSTPTTTVPYLDIVVDKVSYGSTVPISTPTKLRVLSVGDVALRYAVAVIVAGVVSVPASGGTVTAALLDDTCSGMQ